MKDTLTFFNIAKPNPTVDDAQVQLGVHLEEIAEMFVDGLGHQNDVVAELYGWSDRYKNKLDYSFVQDMDRVLLLDSLADQYVTMIGTARALGMNIEGAIKQVEASNLSKFIYVGQEEVSPEQLAQFASEANQIELEGRYSGVHWKRVGEYIVFYDENGKILKAPSTYFGPDLKEFV